LIPRLLTFPNVLPADDIKTEQFKRTRYWTLWPWVRLWL